MSSSGTAILKVNPPLGRRPVLQNCLLDELAIDPTYQRSIDNGPSQALIRRIAQFWNWDLCLPLVVARRPDGALFVVDGQHRLSAARLRREITDLPCVITEYRDPAAEAASFVQLNQSRRALSAIDIFRASLASGDGEAATIAAILAAHGLSIAPHSNYRSWKPGHVSNISGLIAALRQYGPDVFFAAAKILSAAFGGQVLRYAGTIWPGIVAMVALELNDDQDLQKFIDGELAALMVDMVAGLTQPEWLGEINRYKGDHPNAKWQTAAREVFIASWQECLDAFFDESEAA